MTGIESYMREVCNCPILSDDEERELIRRYAETKDKTLRAKLVAANLNLVVQVAHKYTRTKSVMDDLIQEGNIGLFEALEKFDLGRNCKFATYAVYFVRGRMVQFLMENSSEPIFDDDDSSALALQEKQDRLELPREPDALLEQAQENHVKSRIKELLAYFEQTLDQRELEIFRSLWRSEERSPMRELSQRCGITPPRIHQIGRDILKRLKAFLGERIGSAALTAC